MTTDGGPRILIVDDEPAIRRFLRASLTALGCTVFEAVNGAERFTRCRPSTKVAALDAGADDYLTKPFGIDELMARVRVVLRRSLSAATEPVFQTGGLLVDLGKRRVVADGREVSLTPTEYDLLRTFVQHAGKVLTHRQLLTHVWGVAYQTEAQLLRVSVSNLRRKIEENPARPVYLITEPGVGYRLRSEE